jgi:16S rRNA (cytosine1402-N4)-methyltransferase
VSEEISSSPTPAPHKRRVRYSGKNPRRFEEKYKEHVSDDATIAKILASGKTPAGTHRPIMVAEILEILAPNPGDIAADCTLGYGGHAQEILKKISPDGKLLGLDQDPIELPKTETRLRALGFDETIFTAHRSNFAGLPQVLASVAAVCDRRGDDDARRSQTAATRLDLILADLGVSSMQIDDPARGFSVKFSGPLDMRMNPQRGQPASAFLEKIKAAPLAELLVENSDEPNANILATALAEKKFTTTNELANAIKIALPRLNKDDLALTVRRVFQALRIAVNDEFSALETFLRNLPVCLKPGGRVAILTFHSGEDRRVKKAFADGHRNGIYSEIVHEVIRPTVEERNSNPRSAPAKLRWAKRA